jgi:hypothetical protein
LRLATGLTTSHTPSSQQTIVKPPNPAKFLLRKTLTIKPKSGTIRKDNITLETRHNISFSLSHLKLQRKISHYPSPPFPRMLCSSPHHFRTNLEAFRKFVQVGSRYIRNFKSSPGSPLTPHYLFPSPSGFFSIRKTSSQSRAR